MVVVQRYMVNINISKYFSGRCGRDRMDLQKLPVQSVPITTKVVNLNLVHGEVYSIQHHGIKFFSDLRQVGGFLRVLWFSPPIKLTAMV